MKKAIIALAAMGLSSAAMAGPSWTYVDGAYIVSSSFNDQDIDGYQLEGSLGLFNIWHIAGTYGSADDDGAGLGEIDSYYNVRGGVHPAITDSTDFVAEIGYTQWDLKNGPADGQKPTAYDLTVGVRSMVADDFELNAFLSAQSGDLDGSGGNDDFTNLAPSVGGQYFFLDHFSVNVSYTWNDIQSAAVGSSDTAQFGVRWSF